MPNAADTTPFNRILAVFDDLPAADGEAVAAVSAREKTLTKPPGALGRLEDIAQWLAAWQGRAHPRVQTPMVMVFAGNHGVTAQGVSPYPATVTAQMVENFRTGGAAVNQICQTFGVGLKVFELALDMPTADITVAAAMDEEACANAFAYGMAALDEPYDLVCIGEMGIGNTTIAAAVALGLFGGQGADWAGPGTGLDREGVVHKADVIDRALKHHGDHLSCPLEVLRRLGGRELSAMAGAIVAARVNRVPVLIDGFVASAAAAVVHSIKPGALDHCMAAHRSGEPAHGRLLEAIDKKPLFDLGMRLGEGSGAALAVAVVQAAAACHTGMATFAQAAVSDRN